MVEAFLASKNATLKVKISVKAALSAGIIALAVILPQLVHLALGQAGGVKWLPMYLPVLLGGCLLGWKWGLGIGILSPLVSFLITLAAGSPMPAAVRLPYMMAELAVFASVAGLFSKSIAKNCWMAFPAVLLAAVAGRTAFIVITAIFQSVSPLSVALVWSQINQGLLALLLQAVIVPAIVMALSLILKNDKS